MRALLADTGSAWLRPVEQARVADEAGLQARMRAVVDAGGEGLVLHHRDSYLRPGAAAAVLKLKPFDDAEARVVGHTPGRGKYAAWSARWWWSGRTGCASASAAG